METSISESAGSARIKIQGDIDESGAQLLKRQFMENHLAGKNEVVLDFQEVGHIGSAGLGKLLLFYKDLAVHGGSLKIENASSTICELCRELKLDTLFFLARK
jgi:anti-sigma B factor antagonist